MEFQDNIRMNDFLESCTWRDDLQEWLEALSQCERWKAAHPETNIPPRVAAVLLHMVAAYQILRVQIEDASCYDQPAPVAVTNVILGMARMVRREIPSVPQIGHK